jgi:hypothetical protein
MGQLNYTTAEINTLLAQTEVRQDAGVMGENTSTGITLDGAGTWVDLGLFSESGDSGNVTVNGTTGEITIGSTGVYQINMHVGVIENGSTKDWEFVSGWDVNGVTEAIGSSYIASNKSSTASIAVILTRGLTAADVVKLRVSSLLKAVNVDITNSSFEVLRQF